MDILPQTPRIVGTTEIPAKKARRAATGGKRGPGRFYLHGGERSAFARSILENLTPGQATIIEFENIDDLRLYSLVLYNVNRYVKNQPHIPVKTKSYGLRLRVWLNDRQPRLL